jgi:hypothetical protein
MRIAPALLIGFLVTSCVHSIPGYKRSTDPCAGPIPKAEMRRRTPTSDEVEQVWSLLNLSQGEVIEGWYEDRVGNIELGIGGNTQHWSVSLVKVGEDLTVKEPRWRDLEIVCVG